MHFSWDDFLARYGALARQMARSLTGRESDLDDLVQEAALALLSALNKEPERFLSREHARNYFLRALRNRAISFRERATRSPEPFGEPPIAAPADEPTVLSERRRALAESLDALEATDRDLMTRRFLRRQTLALVSTETGVPVSTLHAREKALLRRLRQQLDRKTQEGTEP